MMELAQNTDLYLKDYGLTVHICLISFQFLTELTKLFQKGRNSGSVMLTMKRCKYIIFAVAIQMWLVYISVQFKSMS